MFSTFSNGPGHWREVDEWLFNHWPYERRLDDFEYVGPVMDPWTGRLNEATEGDGRSYHQTSDEERHHGIWI